MKILENNDLGFFMLVSIGWWRKYLAKGFGVQKKPRPHRKLLSNIGYSMQYLEFLDYVFGETERKLHSTVQKMTCKTFVITSVAAVEGFAFYLLKIKAPHDKISGKARFDEIIKKIRHHRLMNLDESEFEELSRLKKLRNKVHVQTVLDKPGHDRTDYNTFTTKEYRDCRLVLRNIFLSTTFSPTESDIDTLDWLL